MSHLNFWILAFFTNFCPIKTDLSGNTVWPQASGFQKLAKMDNFWHFWLTFVHSLRSQCWMRLFLWFSNTVREGVNCHTLKFEDHSKKRCCLLPESWKVTGLGENFCSQGIWVNVEKLLPREIFRKSRNIGYYRYGTCAFSKVPSGRSLFTIRNYCLLQVEHQYFIPFNPRSEIISAQPSSLTTLNHTYEHA